MKRALLLLFAALATACLAQKKSAQQVSVEKQMARIAAAYEHKDASTIQAAMAADFRGIGIGGQNFDLAHLMAQVHGLFSAAKSIKATSEVRSFKLENGNAHLIARETMDFQAPGKGGKLDKYHLESTEEEIDLGCEQGNLQDQVRQTGYGERDSEREASSRIDVPLGVAACPWGP